MIRTMKVLAPVANMVANLLVFWMVALFGLMLFILGVHVVWAVGQSMWRFLGN
jgi:hypothetical protein